MWRSRSTGPWKQEVVVESFQQFAQGEAPWKECHFDFGVLIGAEYPPLLDTLKVVEQMTDKTDTPMVRALDGEHADRLDLEKVSKEVYEVLVTITEGEVKLMVENVPNNDGVLAYHRLHRHYNQRTLSRVLRKTRDALHPKAVQDLKLTSKVVEWEDKWARMAAERNETLPVIWKMAALMELCRHPPPHTHDVQDVMYQNVDGVSEDYDNPS